jgi:glycosyl transferase, family 25
MANACAMHYQPPIYVINMAKDTARMASMAAQLGAQGLAFERVEAVAGRELSAEQRKAHYSDFWFRLLHGRTATPNELGCTLSHHKAWKLMQDRGQEWAVFFEDDAALAPDFAARLKEFEAATRNFDGVQFHSFRVPDINVSAHDSYAFRVLRFSGPNASAIAYALRTSGVQTLLKHDRVMMNADKWVWARALWGLKMCAIYPFPVTPHEAHSAVSTIGNAQLGSRANSGLWRVAVLPFLRVVRYAMLKLRRV